MLWNWTTSKVTVCIWVQWPTDEIMCYAISIRPAYMDEYEKLEEELKKAYEVIIAGSNFFF